MQEHLQHNALQASASAIAGVEGIDLPCLCACEQVLHALMDTAAHGRWLPSSAQAWAEATDVLGVLREGNFGAAKRNSLISDDAAARQLSSAA